jgi:hypothetical protein
MFLQDTRMAGGLMTGIRIAGQPHCHRPTASRFRLAAASRENDALIVPEPPTLQGSIWRVANVLERPAGVSR